MPWLALIADGTASSSNQGNGRDFSAAASRGNRKLPLKTKSIPSEGQTSRRLNRQAAKSPSRGHRTDRGARTQGQIEDNLGALDARLTQAHRSRLDEATLSSSDSRTTFWWADDEAGHVWRRDPQQLAEDSQRMANLRIRKASAGGDRLAVRVRCRLASSTDVTRPAPF